MGNAQKIAKEIIGGRRLRPEESVFLLEERLEDVMEGADWIRRERCGNRVELCAIVNGRCGRCGEDCKFCAQSSHHRAKVFEHPLLSSEELAEDCLHHEKRGVRRYSVVTAGRELCGKEFDAAVCAYEEMAKRCPGIRLCASCGLLKEDAFSRLKKAGVTRYHANIETSRRNFPNVCTTHSYGDKLEVIARARDAGLEICSGGIIGMGETWADRVEMAAELAGLCVDSIPINVLTPIPGTPYEDMDRISEEDILRTVAIFRYFNPACRVLLAAGRSRMKQSGINVFRAGANGAITGDMLTTSGSTIAGDQMMLKSMGFEL